MEAIHLERTQVELDANSFVQDSFVHPAQIIEPYYSINIMLSRNVSYCFVKVLVLLVCERTDCVVRSHNVPSRSKRIACGVTTRGVWGRGGKRIGSVRLAFSTGGKDGPLTFDLLFNLQARLQHLEFLCQRAKLSQHVGSPLPTQRLCASDQQKLTRHRREDPNISPFTVERNFVAVNYSRKRHSALGLCLVARAQPDDGEDHEANHHDGYDDHPNESPEQPREVGGLHACFEQQEHGNEIAHARTGCNGRTLTTATAR